MQTDRGALAIAVWVGLVVLDRSPSRALCISTRPEELKGPSRGTRIETQILSDTLFLDQKPTVPDEKIRLCQTGDLPIRSWN